MPRRKMGGRDRRRSRRVCADRLPAAPITAIDFRAADGRIGITRRDGTEHGIYATRAHADQFAAMHRVALMVDGQPAAQ